MINMVIFVVAILAAYKLGNISGITKGFLDADNRWREIYWRMHRVHLKAYLSMFTIAKVYQINCKTYEDHLYGPIDPIQPKPKLRIVKDESTQETASKKEELH